MKKVIFSIVIILTATPSFSTEPIIIDDTLEYSNIGLNLEYLIDKEGKLIFEDIVSKSNLNWLKSKNTIPSFGFTRDVYWMRFKVKNPTDNAISFYKLVAIILNGM